MVTLIFLVGLRWFVWVNILTLSPSRVNNKSPVITSGLILQRQAMMYQNTVRCKDLSDPNTACLCHMTIVPGTMRADVQWLCASVPLYYMSFISTPSWQSRCGDHRVHVGSDCIFAENWFRRLCICCLQPPQLTTSQRCPLILSIRVDISHSFFFIEVVLVIRKREWDDDL